MITKQQIVDAINALPEDKFENLEAIIEEIILLEKIHKGVEAAQRGELIGEEDVDKETEKWWSFITLNRPLVT